MCNQYFQVTAKHPFFGQTGRVHDNIFACGDVAMLPTKEIKSVVSIMQYATYLAQNVDAVITKGYMKALPNRLHELLGMATGGTEGFLMFNNMTTLNSTQGKEKYDLALMRMRAWTQNDKAAIKEVDGIPQTVPTLFNCVAGWSGCCCCCPCHICCNSAG